MPQKTMYTTKIVIIFFKNLIISKRPKNISRFSSNTYFTVESWRISGVTGQIEKNACKNYHKTLH